MNAPTRHAKGDRVSILLEVRGPVAGRISRIQARNGYQLDSSLPIHLTPWVERPRRSGVGQRC
jgi:hypothetical protein